MPQFNDNDHASALSGALDRQIAAMDSLRECLEDEHRALQARDPEQLLSITERKNACLTDAGLISRQYLELESRQAEPTTTVPGIDGQRDRLDTLTRMCRDLNTANGSMIRRQKDRVERTLQILHGEPERTDVYGPSGVTTDRNPAHRFLATT